MAEPTEVGTGFFRIFADFSALTKGMDDARKKVQEGGTSVEKTFSGAFKRGISDSGSLLNTLGEKAGQVFGILSSKTALAGQGFAILGLAIKESRDAMIAFNHEFNRFAVLVADQPDQIGRARKAIKDLGAELGSAEERSAALRGAFLQVGNVDAAQKVAAAALKLADVVGGDLTGSLEAVNTTMAAFRDQGVTAEKAASTLFQVFRSGGGSIEEVGFLMARAGTLAATAGVKLDDLAGVMVALGSAGLTTRQRMMTLFDLIGNLTTGADKFTAVGVDMKTILAEEGLGGALRKLNELTGGNVEQLQQFGVSAQATAGTVALMKAAVAGTLPELDKLGKAGEQGFGAAQQERAKEYTRQVKALSDAWGELKIEVGEAFIPAGTTFLTILQTYVSGIREIVRDTSDALGILRTKIGEATTAAQEMWNRIPEPIRRGLGLLSPVGGGFTPQANAQFQVPLGTSPELAARGRDIFNATAAANRAGGSATAAASAGGRTGARAAETFGAALSDREKAVIRLEEVERKAQQSIDQAREANFRNELQRSKELEDLKRQGYLNELDLLQQVEAERAKIEGRPAPSVVPTLLARDAAAAQKFQSDLNLATETGASKLRDIGNQLEEARAQFNIFAAQPGQRPSEAAGRRIGGNLLGLGVGQEAPGQPGGSITVGGRTITFGPEEVGAGGEGAGVPTGTGALNREALQARAKALQGNILPAVMEQYVQLKAAVAQGELTLTEETNRQTAERAMLIEKFRQEEFKNTVDTYKKTLEQTRAYYSELDRIRGQQRGLGTLTVAGDIAGMLEATGRRQATAAERTDAAIQAKNAIVKAEQDVFDIRKALLQRTTEDEVNFERQRVERAVQGSQERLDAEKRYISALNSLYQQRGGLAGTAIGLSMGAGRKVGTLADIESDVKRQLERDQAILRSAERGGAVNLQQLEQARGRVNLGEQFQSVGGIGAALRTGLISQKQFLEGQVGGGQFGNIGQAQDRLTDATIDLTGAVEKLADIMATVGGQLTRQRGGTAGVAKTSEEATDYMLTSINRDREAAQGRNR